MTTVLLSRGDSIGGYRLLESIGGSTRLPLHVAEDLASGGRVILKMSPLDSASDVERLRREADLLGAIGGPGVVACLGHGVSLAKGVAWLASPAFGPPLSALLASGDRGRLPDRLALAAALATAEALAALHARGWCHADVKPGNILLSGAGQAVLADVEFASRPAERNGDEAWIPFPGTTPFVAPELWAKGARALGRSSDVWALGVMLYLCLTGEYPFGSGDLAAVAAAATRGRLPAREERFSGPVDLVLGELLAVDLAVRPADGRCAADLLAEAVRGLGLEPARARLELGQAVKALPIYSTILGPITLEAFPPPAPSKARGGAPAPEPPAPPKGAPTPSAAYLEIQTSLIGPAEAGPVAGAVRAAGGEPAEGLRRRAAARWFMRMNPARNFPLTVILSGKKIRVLDARGMKVSVGTREIVLDPEHPCLDVEPSFPGCLIMPPASSVDVSEETTTARFWITPLSEGAIPEACVRIRYRGRLVETLPTPARVVTRTWARLCLAMGFLSPVLMQVLEGEIREGFPLLGRFFQKVGPGAGVLLVGALFLLAAAVLYRLARPVASEPEPALVA